MVSESERNNYSVTDNDDLHARGSHRPRTCGERRIVAAEHHVADRRQDREI
jgi:hypothetical protein